MFTDYNVHMLMVMLALFDSDDSDESIRRQHSTLLHMLQGHIRAHSTNPEWELAQVLNCVKDLPRLTELQGLMYDDSLGCPTGE